MLTKKQFDILVFFSDKKEKVTQREISRVTNISVGTVNKVIHELNDLRCIKDGHITSTGFDMLEPYRVKRAVFMAAGFGSRLVPITLNTPKPLVRINGKRIIDSLLDAVVKVGINEIYIVRGYLSEQFDQLLYKYPMIKFIENPAYNESNNISSAICASSYMKNAYVMDADIWLKNSNLITKYQYASNYLGVPVNITDDWCFNTYNGYIDSIALGGQNCHCWIGISYWDEIDGSKLVGHIKEVYQSPGGKERFWDQVPLEYFKNDYKVFVRDCTFDDVIEIDTFRELKEIDKSYDV